MINIIIAMQLHIVFLLFTNGSNSDATTYPLTVKVSDLRNSEGLVQFAIYNNKEAFPDEHYKKYYQKRSAQIVDGASEITFENLPAGTYAVNILHDEDENGAIKKGLIFPKEGIGFSNYHSIGFSNRPNFEKASFEINSRKTIHVKMIYF